ncbi:MAG: Lrp/AsnC family transcriptional regulator [FCB group bacterium]|nr:Lrp/AsnC family transcriptional regulator [FCB group bacterium]
MWDKKDLYILELLQRNARMTASEVASEVGLSVPAAAERIKKLVDQNLITGFYARVNAKKLGFDLTAFIAVVSSSSDHYEDIINQSEAHPSVLECHSVTGEGSHLLKVRIRNSTELEKLLLNIQAWPGVIRTHTMVVLSTYKECNALNLRQ